MVFCHHFIAGPGEEDFELLTVAFTTPPALLGGSGPSCCTYPDSAKLVLVDGNVGAKGRHGDTLHVGHGRAASVLVFGGDSEGCQALSTDPRAAHCCQHIVAGALEVKRPAIEGVVVRVAPQPARDVVVGHTHALATLIFACLLWPALHTIAWV